MSDAEPVEFELNDFEELPVKSFDQRDRLEVTIHHTRLIRLR
jgi:hypothetical protein